MTRSRVRRGFCLFAAVLVAALPGELAAENTSLSQTYPKEELARMLLPRDRWHPFPKAAERAAWQALWGAAPQAAGDTDPSTLLARGEHVSSHSPSSHGPAVSSFCPLSHSDALLGRFGADRRIKVGSVHQKLPGPGHGTPSMKNSI